MTSEEPETVAWEIECPECGHPFLINLNEWYPDDRDEMECWYCGRWFEVGKPDKPELIRRKDVIEMLEEEIEKLGVAKSEGLRILKSKLSGEEG